MINQLSQYQINITISTLNIRINTLKDNISDVYSDYLEGFINPGERDEFIAIYQQQIDDLQLIINTIGA